MPLKGSLQNSSILGERTASSNSAPALSSPYTLTFNRQKPLYILRYHLEERRHQFYNIENAENEKKVIKAIISAILGAQESISFFSSEEKEILEKGVFAHMVQENIVKEPHYSTWYHLNELLTHNIPLSRFSPQPLFRKRALLLLPPKENMLTPPISEASGFSAASRQAFSPKVQEDSTQNIPSQKSTNCLSTLLRIFSFHSPPPNKVNESSLPENSIRNPLLK